MEKKILKNALRRAKYQYEKGIRYYDEKHNTYNPVGKVANILEHVSDMVEAYGIECYDPNDYNPMMPKYEYINMGETYALTIIFNHDTGQYRFLSIGDLIERTDKGDALKC